MGLLKDAPPRADGSLNSRFVRRISLFGSVFVLCTGIVVGDGCSSNGHVSASAIEVAPSGERSTVTPGDWDDVDAAVVHGSEAGESVIVAREDVGPDRVEYTLRAATGETGYLSATREGRDGVRVACRFGHFDADTRASKVIQSVARRLEELQGVEWAPISGQ